MLPSFPMFPLHRFLVPHRKAARADVIKFLEGQIRPLNAGGIRFAAAAGESVSSERYILLPEKNRKFA